MCFKTHTHTHTLTYTMLSMTHLEQRSYLMGSQTSPSGVEFLWSRTERECVMIACSDSFVYSRDSHSRINKILFEIQKMP